MSPILITATIIVNFALISYTVGIISEQRNRRISRFSLNFLRIGVVFDVAATACMIAGSSHGPFTPHGMLGFSSLTAMVIETSLAWRHRKRSGDGEVPRRLHLYSRAAYTWWVLAYFTGAYLAMSA